MAVKEQERTGLSIAPQETMLLQPFRDEFLQRPAVSMPPHVTIRTFLPAPNINEEIRQRLRTFFQAFSKFSFKLERIDRFMPEGVLYLAPEPTESLYQLYDCLCEEFSLKRNHPVEPVFHMTLAGWHANELDQIERRFREKYGNLIPIQARAVDVRLYERIGGTRWREDSVYPLCD